MEPEPGVALRGYAAVYPKTYFRIKKKAAQWTAFEVFG